MNNYSPIVLFVFSRPDHTQRTIDALSANVLASESDLIIYSDAARCDEEVINVTNVRRVIKSANGFRSVTIIERNINYGLARSIIEGVTDVCNHFDRAIVLEDDILTSPLFLAYMNSALDHYASEKKVWHVSGWNYPIDPTGLGEMFFLRVMNCWGWATWSDRWLNFEKNTERLINEFDRDMINRFDLDGSGVFWSQVLLNRKNKMNTWAIYWYATIFRCGGLCLNPTVSYTKNIGHDGSGTHGSLAGEAYSTRLNTRIVTEFPLCLEENATAIERIKSYYRSIRPSFTERVVRYISSITRKV